MTFAELKSSLRLELFPQGEAPELVGPHNKSIISGLIDLQKKVECLRVNNTQVFNFCSTYFQCGLSVFAAPRGKINKVSVYARLDEECEEDAEADVNWCDEVEYRYIDYPRLTRMMDRQLRCACNTTFESLLTLDIGFCKKTLGDAYSAPTNADYSGFPTLPQGFHFPQASTDSTKGRARNGVWAMDRGKIYLAPWIQSTEVAVVKYEGIQRDWNSADMVDDDPALGRAIKLFVSWEHARDYDKNTVDYEIYEKEYREAVADLIHSCDDETKEHVQRPSKARMSQRAITDAPISDCTSTTTAPGNLLNLSGSGSPYDVVTPDYIGQYYLDTDTPSSVWVSTGLTDTDWLQVVGGIAP